MYKSTPWTLEEKKSNTTRKSIYVKNREADLAISVSRVQKFLELHKEKTFTIAQISEALNLSEGTISSIMNRLITIGDINVVKMQRPHWSPVFQHVACATTKVPFSYKKEDPILSILNMFENNKNEVYTKEDLLKSLSCSESMIRRSLQILLSNKSIKLIGSNEKGEAQYQNFKGDLKEIPIRFNKDENYSSISNYIKKNGLKLSVNDILKNLDIKKRELFYTATGLMYEYPIEELDKTIKKINKKGIIGKLFSK